MLLYALYLFEVHTCGSVCTYIKFIHVEVCVLMSSSTMWKCVYLRKVHPCGSVCTYVKFIHTLSPSTMVIKSKTKKGY
jgi:hypothetical protein